jgi:hypothetical protein
MADPASNLWKHLSRLPAADPRHFAAGSTVSHPLGLLAVEEACLAGDVTGPAGRDRIRRDHRRPCDTTGVGAEDAHGHRPR